MASVDQVTAKLSAAQIADNIQKAEAEKAAGNAALQAKNLKKAIEHYTNAINLNKNNHVYYSNRSAAYLLNNSAKHSISDAQKCIEINADWSKGYSRLGAALHFAGRYQEAYDAYSNGLEKDPQNQTLLDGLTHADTALGRGEGPMVKADITVPGSKDAGAEKGHVIGIDLGTTFSCVAVWEGEEGVKIIPDSEGNLTTPSIISFAADGQREVGHNAKRMATSNVKNTVYDVKRVLGSLMTDEQVLKDVKTFPYKVKVGAGDKPVISVEQDGKEKDFHPEEISAMVLSKMKKIAEEHLGEEVHRAVITVPAYFNDAQRQATKDAGMIAGLEVMRIINEPTAAALAYGLDMKGDYTKHEQRNILVFDLGGGTFDVSLLSIDGGIFEVKATAGDTHLGGEDFDEALLNHLADEFNAANSGKDIRSNLKSMKRVRQAAEKAKILLSTNDSANVVLEALLDGVDFNTKVSKETFEKLNQVLFNRCMDTVKRVLADAKMAIGDIEDIVLVGGSTRIPKLQEMLSGHFGGKDLCKSINPDEAVAYGAAVQGAILSGMRPAATQQLLLVDVTALSLGIELEGKVFSTIIPRNTKVPCNRRKTYTTTEDYQNAVDVVIFEGERQCTDGNNLLGEFKITNIEKAKRGEPKVEVSFNLDTNGILNVTAKDLVTQSVAQVTLNNNRSRLTPEQIEKMLQDAEEHKEEDRRRVENIEARNELEGALYSVIDAAKQANQLETVLKAEEVRSWLENGVGKTTKEIRDKINVVNKLM